MPYEIIESQAGGKKGYRLRKKGTNDYYSKKALPLQKVKNQRTAIIISEFSQPKASSSLREHKAPIKKFESGVLGIPKQFKGLHVPNKPLDFGDVILGVLEPNERILSVENNKKIENMIKKGKIPKLAGFEDVKVN